MKISPRYLMLPLMAIALSSCARKEIPTTIHGYFYTPDASMGPEQPVHLYMDGVDKGLLPYIAGTKKDEPLSADDSMVRTRTLQFDFPSGEHTLEARTKDGKFVCASRMYVRIYKDGASSGTGPVGGYEPGTSGSGASYNGNTRQYVAYLFR